MTLETGMADPSGSKTLYTLTKARVQRGFRETEGREKKMRQQQGAFTKGCRLSDSETTDA